MVAIYILCSYEMGVIANIGVISVHKLCSYCILVGYLRSLYSRLAFTVRNVNSPDYGKTFSVSIIFHTRDIAI